jgi:hypothetical protein
MNFTKFIDEWRINLFGMRVYDFPTFAIEIVSGIIIASVILLIGIYYDQRREIT